MLTSALIALALVISLHFSLLEDAHATLRGLWHGDLLSPRSETQSVTKRQGSVLAFVHGLESLFNHRVSWALGLFFAAVVFMLLPLRLHGGWTLILTALAAGFVLGQLVWRTIVTAWAVYQLGRVFDLQVYIYHPDKSGGLKILGDLCFNNSLVISVPGIFLAEWIIAIQYLELGAYVQYTSLFQRLLLANTAFAFGAFFPPLYAVHQAMVRSGAQVRRQLDEFSLRIDKESQISPDEGLILGGEQRQESNKQLHLLYRIHESFPVWPINKNIVVKFIMSQTIPLLGLTGASFWLLKSIEALLN